MSDRKNIKLHTETFEDLKDDKANGETWDHFLLRLLYEADG